MLCCNRLLLFLCPLVLEERFCFPSVFRELLMEAIDVIYHQDAGLRQPLYFSPSWHSHDSGAWLVLKGM